MSECSLQPGDRFDNISAIRKILFGLSEFRERAGVVLLVIPASEVNFRKVWIERERVIEGILGRRPPRRPWLESFPEALDLRNGEICPCQRKIRIQLYCLLIQTDCTLDITVGVKTPANGNRPRAQIGIV